MVKYSYETLLHAKKDVLEGKISMRKAAKDFKIPFQTLRNHVKEINKSNKRGPKPILGDYEEEIRSACDALVDVGLGLRKKDVFALASQVCEKANVRPFKKNNVPTNKWFRGFKKRKRLSLRSPASTSLARMDMTTEAVKNEFFSSLQKVYHELVPKGLNASTVFNLDETGLCAVMKSGKVVCSKGSKQVRALKGGERGENVSALVTVNASGTIILPPMLIFRGKCINEDVMKEAMADTLFAYSPKSYIDTELFKMWFERFLQEIPPKRPVLVLMDGHSSHIGLEVIELALANGITLLCFPPHTTHLYQPLDRGVFGPLKEACSTAADSLMKRNRPKMLNKYHISKILAIAWPKAVNQSNAVSGFKITGIWPFNPNAVKLSNMPSGEMNLYESQQSTAVMNVETEVFNDPSTVESRRSEPGTTNFIESQENMSTSSFVNQGNYININNNSTVSISIYPEPVSKTPQHKATAEQYKSRPRQANQTNSVRIIAKAPNFQSNWEPSVQIQPPLQSSSNFVSPVVAAVKELFAPENNNPPSVRSRRITTTRLLTAKEFVEELRVKEAEKEKKKLEKEQQMLKKQAEKKAKAKGKENSKPRKKKKAIEAKDNSQSENSSLSDPDDPAPVAVCEDEQDELCGVCGGSFLKDFNGEQWIQCRKCKVWFHLKCQNLSDYTPDFCCPLCVKDTPKPRAVRSRCSQNIRV